MSKFQNYLIPSFLKRIDFWLMTHKPHIWRTRGHFVVFYCLIASVLLYFLGRAYPQNFADFHDFDYMKSNHFSNYLTSFLTFISIGIVTWWWYTIQKFGYKRTNFKHFLIEIGIYTLGLYAITTLVFSFDKGFSKRQAYELEKNTREDSAWVAHNGYFHYGYMPHFFPNKELNLDTYFKQGEDLNDVIYNRQAIVFNILREENEKIIAGRDYNQAYDQGIDPFSFSHWEYPQNTMKYNRPPQYKKPADYVNKILSNDTFWKQEEKRLKLDEKNASREILTSMPFEEWVQLVNEIYPKFFNRINYFTESQSTSRLLLKQWISKRLFLESLSPQEVKDYRDYLNWLKNNYALYSPQPILNFEHNAGRGFMYNRDDRGNYVRGKNSYVDLRNIICNEYFDRDKNELAGEKLLLLFEKLDVESFKYYQDYLQNSGYQNIIKENDKNPIYKAACQNYFSVYRPNSVNDSLYFYDYFDTKNINAFTWLDIIADKYAHHVVNNYNEDTYNRFRNLLHVNSFEDVYKKSKNPIIQKLIQLNQAEDYQEALRRLAFSRNDYETNEKWRSGLYAILRCVFMAIIFYVITLSNGLQFWVSVFISGFFAGLIVFIEKANILRLIFGGYTSYPPLSSLPQYDTNYYSSGEIWTKWVMLLCCLLLFLLSLVLIFKKVQLARAHIWVNTLLFSCVTGVLCAFEYWTSKVQIQLQTENDKDDVYLSIDEKITLYSLVLLAVIGIYLLITWLYKRHLTLPKKK